MKMNMIISKKHIVLSALVLALSVAVYLNWEYVKTNGDSFESTSKIAVSGEVAEDPAADETAAYGEAYFAEAKLSRTKSRDEAADALKYMLEDANLTTDQMTELTLQAAAIAEAIEVEGKIENLIKAKGVEDCMVYYDTEQVDVVVRSDGLEPEQVAQMKEIILQETQVPVENISIVEIG